MARILSVWSTFWPTTAWRLNHPARPGAAPAEAPLALVAKIGAKRVLTAVDPAAQALGLDAGMKAADAQSLVPELRLEPSEPALQAKTLARLADWCARFSPAVAEDPPDGLLLDIEGLAHLWGGEARLLDDLSARLAERGVTVQLGVADTVGAAWALARFAPERPLASPGGQEQALRLLPTEALRLEAQAAAQLRRLGLTRIGALAGQDRAALTRRFGEPVMLRLDQALGRAPEALAFRRPPTPWLHRLRLVEPISTPEDLARVTADLASGLCARLEATNWGARRFEFAFHRLDGAAQAVEIGLARAGRDPATLLRLARPKLDYVDPGFGIECATLAAHGLARLSPHQAQLENDAQEARAVQLDALIDSLSNRLGPQAVWRPVPVESHAPERAVARLPAQAGNAPFVGWDVSKPRPIRLFERPEPIEATALLPDDPPLQFRWRGMLHRVRRAEGPERITREWWRQNIDEVSTGQLRDYYRVEDEAGARFWVFRAGLHGAERTPRWWLHGVFG